LENRLKSLIKNIFSRLGYEIRPIAYPTAGDVRESAAALKLSEAYTKWAAPYPTFAPWTGDPDFRAIYNGAARHTLASPAKCYFLISLARYAAHLPGDFVECGVYKGGTALLLARILKNADKVLYLFDSFQGLPEVDARKDGEFRKGEFAVELDSVKALFADFGNRVDIRPGWIPQTLGGLKENRYAFIHLDVDIYQSVLDCCNYFYSRVSPGGILLFDEYGLASAHGEKEAVDEFLVDKPESPIVLPTGQAIVLKI
jgi:O-methyltransferase